jgi:hypothetical protein
VVAITVGENMITDCHVDEALSHINQAEYGVHYMIIYPNLDTFRQLYSDYTYKQLKENNEIVLVNPFYETADSVRHFLSEKDEKDNPVLDVSKYEKEGALIIADSLKEYLSEQPHMHLKESSANYIKMGKNGLSVLADMGAYAHKSKYKELVDYELSLPTKYNDDVPMKGFCLYHKEDFDRFSDEQKQKLIEHHGKALKIMEAKPI